MLPPPPRSTLFPYTTLFRSQPHAQELLGSLYANDNQLDRAMETWRELIKAQPGRISAYRYLGTAYVRQDRLSEAAALYREGLASNPDHAGLLLLQRSEERRVGKVGRQR